MHIWRWLDETDSYESPNSWYFFGGVLQKKAFFGISLWPKRNQYLDFCRERRESSMRMTLFFTSQSIGVADALDDDANDVAWYISADFFWLGISLEGSGQTCESLTLITLGPIVELDSTVTYRWTRWGKENDSLVQCVAQKWNVAAITRWGKEDDDSLVKCVAQ